MTAFRLAEHVAGTVHVDEMLDGMTPEEFDEWCIKDEVEPIGYHVQATGLLCWLVYSYMAGDKGDAKAEDFMPWVRHQTRKPQNRQAMQAIQILMGGGTK